MIDTKVGMNQEDNLALAKKIADAIKASHLSAKEIAEQCEVKPQAVSGWKKTGRIKKATLVRFAEVVDVPLSQFISSSDGVREGLNLKVVRQASQEDAVGPAEIIELISAYAQATKKDRDAVMNLAKTAAELAVRGGGRATKDK